MHAELRKHSLHNSRIGTYTFSKSGEQENSGRVGASKCLPTKRRAFTSLKTSAASEAYSPNFVVGDAVGRRAGRQAGRLAGGSQVMPSMIEWPAGEGGSSLSGKLQVGKGEGTQNRLYALLAPLISPPEP